MKNTNQINIPEAREAMDKFKMEARFHHFVWGLLKHRSSR